MSSLPVGRQKKKEKKSNVTVIKKLRDYSEDSTFKKKAASATAFLKKHGLPKRAKKKSK